MDRRRRYYSCAGAALATVMLSAGFALAQEAGAPLSIYEQQLRVALDQQLPAAREQGFDAGGWFNFAFFNYDDAVGDEHTLRDFQLRGWARYNDRGIHTAFFRGLLDYEDWNQGTNPVYNRSDDFNSTVERLWYQFDWGKLVQAQTGQAPPTSVRALVGRDFTTIGSELVMSMPIDKVQVEVESQQWTFKTFLGKSIEDSPNIDLSDAVARHQDRNFFGAELTYKGFDRHRPYVFFMNNHDETEPSRDYANQKFDYSSQYYGAGSSGSLLLRDLRYQAELAGETGQTYGNGATTGRDDIHAYAADVQLQYLFRCRTSPRLMAEWLYASGDGDRESNSSATIGGNRPGTTDRAFNAFGFRDTGLAFAPRISNLNMVSMGAGFKPLENVKLFKEMEVGTKVFLYDKAVSGGPISDSTAANDAYHLGSEWDVYCNWRITSDLSWTVRYGVFVPGAAYSGTAGDDIRHFVYTGFLLSF
ncbi:MAG: alginate export family protein [Planctomycetaceae bacterium]|nr:alginate export family protein [Planctomycetaceae bacterium]